MKFISNKLKTRGSKQKIKMMLNQDNFSYYGDNVSNDTGRFMSKK
jgi:hypothetical protein